MTLFHQIDIQKSKLNTELFKMRILPPTCTVLQRFAHIFSKIFRGVALPDPHNWEGASSLVITLPPPRRSSTVPLFQSFRDRSPGPLKERSQVK